MRMFIWTKPVNINKSEYRVNVRYQRSFCNKFKEQRVEFFLSTAGQVADVHHKSPWPLSSQRFPGTYLKTNQSKLNHRALQINIKYVKVKWTFTRNLAVWSCAGELPSIAFCNLLDDTNDSRIRVGSRRIQICIFEYDFFHGLNITIDNIINIAYEDIWWRVL